MKLALLFLGFLVPCLGQNFVYTYDMEQNAPPQQNLFDASAYRFNPPSTVRQTYSSNLQPAPQLSPSPSPSPAPVSQDPPRRPQRQRSRGQSGRAIGRQRRPPAAVQEVAEYEPVRQPLAYNAPQTQAPAPTAPPQQVQLAYQVSANPSPDQIPEGYEIIEIPRSQIDGDGYFSLGQDGQRYQLIQQEQAAQSPPPSQVQTQPQSRPQPLPQSRARPQPQARAQPQPRPQPQPQYTYEAPQNPYVRSRTSTYEEFVRALPTPPSYIPTNAPATQVQPRPQPQYQPEPSPQAQPQPRPVTQPQYQVTPPPLGSSYYHVGPRSQNTPTQYYQPYAQQYQNQVDQVQYQAPEARPEQNQYQPQDAYQPEPEQYQQPPAESERYRPATRQQQQQQQPPVQEYQRSTQRVPQPQVVHERRRPAPQTSRAVQTRPPTRTSPRPTPAASSESDYTDRRPDTGYRAASIGVASLPEDTDGDGIPGQGGVDYPTLHTVPKTSFSCARQPLGGYYADLETACQLVHFCQAGGIGHSFLCPNGTIFNQERFSCQWWYKVDCSKAAQFYELNDTLYKVPSTTTRAPRRRPAQQQQQQPQQQQQLRSSASTSNNNRPAGRILN